MSQKYPTVELAPDAVERIKSVPVQVWWADEDEPVFRFPPLHLLPLSVALRYGVVREVAAALDHVAGG